MLVDPGGPYNEPHRHEWYANKAEGRWECGCGAKRVTLILDAPDSDPETPTVERFEPGYVPSCSNPGFKVAMKADEKGEWVRHADYLTLLAEHKRMWDTLTGRTQEVLFVQKQLTALQDAVKEEAEELEGVASDELPFCCAGERRLVAKSLRALVDPSAQEQP